MLSSRTEEKMHTDQTPLRILIVKPCDQLFWHLQPVFSSQSTQHTSQQHHNHAEWDYSLRLDNTTW